MTRVLDLGDPRASDTALAGRKMATLATLKAAALPVPPAFVLTTEAGALEDPEVESAVLRAYDRLGRDVPVSVRSSADTEDGTRQSAAGMYGTVLDVVGGDALLAALATCRASAELSHVRAYLGAQTRAEVAMAVGVMHMIAPTVSGVTFTRSPLGTGRTVIEVVPGPLGPLVDGSVIPEHLEVLPEDGTVLMRVEGEHGSNVLADDRVVEVQQMCALVADVLGVDVDVEWAYDGNRLVVLQARPVTGTTAPKT